MRKFTDEDFKKALESSKSWAEISRKLSLHHTGNRITSYKKICNKLSLNFESLKGVRWFEREKVPLDMKWGNRKDLKDILVENSDYKGGTNHIKKRVIASKFLENKCCMCGNEGVWNDLPLTLQMDHINGNNTDNRIENLRILCPNCHSQTVTYGAKKRKQAGDA